MDWEKRTISHLPHAQSNTDLDFAHTPDLMYVLCVTDYANSHTMSFNLRCDSGNEEQIQIESDAIINTNRSRGISRLRRPQTHSWAIYRRSARLSVGIERLVQPGKQTPLSKHNRNAASHLTTARMASRHLEGSRLHSTSVANTNSLLSCILHLLVRLWGTT